MTKMQISLVFPTRQDDYKTRMDKNQTNAFQNKDQHRIPTNNGSPIKQ